METYQMSQKEVNQISVFEKLKRQEITQAVAAEQLRLSIRQVKRKVKRYREYGARGLIHQNRGRESERAFSQEFKDEVMAIVKAQYPDFGPTFASEQLLVRHELRVGHETLRQWMIEAGIWKSKQKKVKVRLCRERKACLGMMIQVDGSPHPWLEDRGPPCTLLAFIDDATSALGHLEFFQSESTEALMQATKKYLLKHGRPLSLYTDRGGVFKVNTCNPDNDKLTQYGRALKELDIELIHARSPQAKGRVERVFQTLQDRLVKELRLNHISTLDEANRYVQTTYLKQHNRRFAVLAQQSADVHRSLAGYQLDRIFCLKEQRLVCHDFTIRYHNAWFQLQTDQPTTVCPRDTVMVNQSLDGTIRLTLRNYDLNYQRLDFKPTKPNPCLKSLGVPKKQYVPPWDHPWRKFTLISYPKGDIFTLRTG